MFNRFCFLSFIFLLSCGQPVLTDTVPGSGNIPANPPLPISSPAPASTPTSLLALPSPSPNPLPASALAGKAPTRIDIPKTSYSAGETILVHYSVDPESVKDPKAWVGLLPADVPHGSATENDKYDLAYQYLEGKNSGDMTFQAPEDPGNYDLRLHDSETNGKELTSIAFTVSGPVKPLIGNAIRLNKSRYAPNEMISISVSIKAEDKLDETAWIGIVPAAVDHGDEATNDKYNLGYRFLGANLFGKTTLPAPKAPGLYDIRLNNTDDEAKKGIELAFVSFVVE